MRRKLILAVLSVLVPAGFVLADPLPVARTSADGVTGYRTARKLAEGGTRVVLVLGGDSSLLTAADKDVYRYTSFTESKELKQFVPGVYDCSKGDNGLPQMLRRTPPPAVVSHFQSAFGQQFTPVYGQTFVTGGCSNGRCFK